MRQDQILVPVNPTELRGGRMDPRMERWRHQKANHWLLTSQDNWNVIHQPRALWRQGGETCAWSDVVSACLSATPKPCLDSTPQEAWTRGCVTAAVGDARPSSQRILLTFHLTALSLLASSHTSLRNITWSIFFLPYCPHHLPTPYTRLWTPWGRAPRWSWSCCVPSVQHSTCGSVSAWNTPAGCCLCFPAARPHQVGWPWVLIILGLLTMERRLVVPTGRRALQS